VEGPFISLLPPMLDVNIFTFLDIIKKRGMVGASGIDFDYFLTSEEEIDSCLLLLFYKEVKELCKLS